MNGKRLVYVTVIWLTLAVMAGPLLSLKANYQEVMRVCIMARNEINGASEERCGELQDKTNTVFNCNGECWLEIKEY